MEEETPTNPERLTKLARLAASMRLEERLLTNPEFTRTPLDRIATTEAVVYGLIQEARWPEAVNMVFSQEHGPLFDHRTTQFREALLAAVKEPAKRPYQTRESLELLVTHEHGSTVLQMLPHINSVSYQDLNAPVLAIPRDVGTPEERAAAQTVLGKKALNTSSGLGERETLPPGALRAYRHFKAADNKREIVAILHQLTYHLTPDNVTALETIAQDHFATPGEFLHNIYEQAITDTRTNQESSFTGKNLYALLHKARNAGIDLPDYDELADRAAAQTSYLGQQEEELGKDFKVRWARTHATTRPKTAYHTLREAEYDGPELITAINTGITLDINKDERLDTHLIPDAHLRAAFPTANTEARMKIIESLADPALARTAAEDILTSLGNNEQEWESSIDVHKKIYRLLRSAGVDNDEPRLQVARATIIDYEFSQDKSPTAIYSIHSLDVTGQRMILARARAQGLDRLAYRTADWLGDEKELQSLREELIKKDPITALQYFRNEPHHDRIDERGIRMVKQHFSKQYDLPLEDINLLLDPQEE